MPASLVFSVNNSYAGLIRANIRYGKNGVMEKSFNGRWVLFKQGGWYIPSAHFAQETRQLISHVLIQSLDDTRIIVCYFCTSNTK